MLTNPKISLRWVRPIERYIHKNFNKIDLIHCSVEQRVSNPSGFYLSEKASPCAKVNLTACNSIIIVHNNRNGIARKNSICHLVKILTLRQCKVK